MSGDTIRLRVTVTLERDGRSVSVWSATRRSWSYDRDLQKLYSWASSEAPRRVYDAYQRLMKDEKAAP